jgi:PAS domain S-box-containing protein
MNWKLQQTVDRRRLPGSGKPKPMEKSLKGTGLCTGIDIAEQEDARSRLTHLARFPIENPNPIVEVNLSGVVTFANPAAISVFPGLRERGIEHPALQGVSEAMADLRRGGKAHLVREIKLGQNYYHRVIVGPVGEEFLHIYLTDITERKLAEETLRGSEESFRSLFEGSRDAIMTNEPPSWRFSSGNPAAVKMFGAKNEEEFVSYDPAQLSPDRQPDGRASAEKAREMLETAVREGSHFFEWTHRRVGGEEFYADVLLTRMKRGTKVFIQGTVRDITDRKRAEETLRASETRYRRFFEAARDGILILNAETGMVVDVNQFLIEMLGFSREQFLGKRIWELGFFKDIAANQASFAELLKNEYIRYEDKPLETSDGRRIQVEFVSYVYQVNLQKVVQCNIRNITERKQGEAALIRAKEEWERTFDAVPDLIALIDANHRIMRVNRAMAERLGSTPQQLVGQICFEVMHGLSARPEFCPHSKMFASGKEDREEVVEERLRGTFDISATPLRDAAGHLVGSVHVARDITERKQGEKDLRRSAESLRTMMDGIIKSMTSVLEMRDPYTAGHERRVAQLACSVAAEMGLPKLQIEGIRFASYLHDIGKIAVPAEILSKPGKISIHEFGIIKMHPQFGYDILKDIDFLWPVALATLQHHERMNGSGYPEGLSGEKIIMEARIIAVADVVEAMFSHRPYRPALGIDAALAEIIANKGTLYDPQVVDACARLFSEKRFQFE